MSCEEWFCEEKIHVQYLKCESVIIPVLRSVARNRIVKISGKRLRRIAWSACRVKISNSFIIVCSYEL
jgi:hypothetical protein